MNSRLTTCFQRAAGSKYTRGEYTKDCLMVFDGALEEGDKASLIRAVCVENGVYFGLVR